MSFDRRDRAQVEARVRELLIVGDREGAMTALVAGLGPGVLGYMLTMLPGDDGYDAYSQFQEDVWRGLAGFRWECSLYAWVYRVAWHAAARLARDGYRRRREPLPSASELAPCAAPRSETWGRHEGLERLREELSSEERNLLTLRVGRELDWDEVCAVLARDGESVSSMALRKRFERIKKKLAHLARDRGLLGGALEDGRRRRRAGSADLLRRDRRTRDVARCS